MAMVRSTEFMMIKSRLSSLIDASNDISESSHRMHIPLKKLLYYMVINFSDCGI